MKTLAEFAFDHLELWLRIIAVAQIALAGLSLCLVAHPGLEA